MTILIKNKHTLQIDNFKFRCCVGKKGFTKNKKEGDKKTPKGTFEIENLYFRKDRKQKPSTLLNCIAIKKGMGWCHDTSFPKKYNKLLKGSNEYVFDKKQMQEYIQHNINKRKKISLSKNKQFKSYMKNLNDPKVIPIGKVIK